MDAVFAYISDFLKMLKITDIIDIIIVAIIIYYLLKMIRDTRAVQLVKGIVILFLALQASAWLNLTTMNFLLRNTMQIGLFAVVVIFQPCLLYTSQLWSRHFGKISGQSSGLQLQLHAYTLLQPEYNSRRAL